jgi:predicted 2-oxoglutarate/Fe(II)-dependent dioxygenase YbiX
MDSEHVVVKSNYNAMQETLSGKYKSIFFINDEYDGGEVSVPNGKYSIKPEKGSIIITPSDTAISMNPIQNGTQYVSFVSWH